MELAPRKMLWRQCTLRPMGSRGAGGLRRWVVGSIADKVIRSARRPVIAIPRTSG
ncbi:MAG TPA: hypothetical protein EYM69_10520 [Dehalococcoidia bacterium]|nr:hypothetical protein [Dehalococcoidia bacterium]